MLLDNTLAMSYYWPHSNIAHLPFAFYLHQFILVLWNNQYQSPPPFFLVVLGIKLRSLKHKTYTLPLNHIPSQKEANFLFFFLSFLGGRGSTTSNARGLLLSLYSVVTPGSARGYGMLETKSESATWKAKTLRTVLQLQPQIQFLIFLMLQKMFLTTMQFYTCS